MRTSGTHSDGSLTVIPVLLLLVMVVILVGGVEDTLRTIDEFCRKFFNTLVVWFKAL